MPHSDEKPFTGLKVTSTDGYFEAARHLGCDVTPRHNASYSYSLCEYQTRPVIHSPAVYDRPRDGRTPTCDLASPAVVLGDDTYSILRLEQGLFLKPAFWAIPGFKISSDRERSVWDFLVQKVLHHSNHSIMLHGTGAAPYTKYLSEKNSYDLLRHLKSVAIPGEGSTAAIIKNLLSALHEDSLLAKTSAWFGTIFDLQDWNMEIPSPVCLSNSVIYRPVSYLSNRHKKSSLPIENLPAIQTLHANVCKKYANITSSTIHFKTPWIQFDSILLVVVFNNPIYETIPYLEAIYRPFFPRILYCGPEQLSVSQNPALQALEYYEFSFISYGKSPEGHVPGALNYKCTELAAQIGYEVQGLLVIGDDLLLVTQFIKTLNPNKVWYVPLREIRTVDIENRVECRLGTCDHVKMWPWFPRYWPNMESLFKAFQEQQSAVPLVNKCVRNLVKVNGAKFRANGAYSDFYYIPTSIAKDFAKLMHIFADHKVFVEIAVATIMQCLVPAEEREFVTGPKLWGKNRDDIWKFFKLIRAFRTGYLHPMKWSYVSRGREQYIALFCNVIMFMHNSKGEITTE